MKRTIAFIICFWTIAQAFATDIFNFPVQFTTGGSLQINSGVPLTGTWAFSGATVDMTGATAINFPAGTVTLTGNVTGSGSGTFATTVVTIPDLVSEPGSILFTESAAPVAPSAGFGKGKFDSTDHRFHDYNSAGTVGTTVVAATAPANQFSTGLGTNGVQTFRQPVPADILGSIPLTGLATQAANTVVGNATAGTAVPTAVAPATARSSSLLNIDQKTAIGDAAYTILPTDRTVVTTTAFTTARTWTLPAANSVNVGQTLDIQDLAGAVNGANTLTVQRAGADLICPPAAGITSFAILSNQVGFGLTLKSDGVSKWFVSAFQPGGVNAAHRPVTGDGRVFQIENYAIPTVPAQIASSISTVSAGYAADTYIGNAVTVNAGDFKVQGQYHVVFDMTKTAAGVATPIITLRVGTLGTTGDAAIMTITFAAGTAVADTATFEGWFTFRSIGSGTSAIVQGVVECRHLLAATGMTTTGASGIGIINSASIGFASTTPTKIGVSFNGGLSFSGTNTLAQAQLTQP